MERAVYGTTKGAVDAITKSPAKELGEHTNQVPELWGDQRRKPDVAHARVGQGFPGQVVIDSGGRMGGKTAAIFGRS